MKTNALIHESSPYLLQHARNPVNWVAWNPVVFEQARLEDKLVLVSIGYSACHWCHVMEHESFEDEEVAAIMNEHFISVKVDREERPDVDMLYMSAVQLMNGQGGWPLNCFVLPDGRPVYGGTYFQKSQWINILQNLQRLYATDREKVLEYATHLSEGMMQAELISTKKTSDNPLSLSVIEKSIDNWKKRFDNEWGGPARAPKFPLPNNYSFLLKYAHLYNDASLLKHVELTLEKMACGGIYDQLGGGFARYSTDMQWKIPHFEKMLYDNAQLIVLYCEAYRLTKNPLYKEVVEETMAFAEREWLSPAGGFYSAYDADSEGEEGKYYVWQKEELEGLLGNDFSLFADYYNVNSLGYWEEDNYILMRASSEKELLMKHHLKAEELKQIIDRCKAILLEERDKRVKPGLDNKILTAWNGLMCKACCEAWLTFKNDRYKELVLLNAHFLKKKMLKSDGSLWRSFSNDKAKIDAFLDDYAFTADAFLSVYLITQDESWLKEAEKLCAYAGEHFYNPSSGLYYYTSRYGEELALRTTETSDNVIPASNSQMALNLYRLAKITSNEAYQERALSMLERFSEEIGNYGSGYSNWASLYLDLLYDSFEICIVGKNVNEKLAELFDHYLPNAIFVVAASVSELEILQQRYAEGKTLIYVCKNKTCQLPAETVKEALIQLETTV